MADDIRRLLHETADLPASPPDVGGIRSRIRRRRTARRGIAGMAAVVLLAGGAALATGDTDGGTEVQVVDRPEDTTTTTEPSEPEAGDGVELGSIGALAPEGIAIETVRGVELRDLEGELLHVIDGYELATTDRDDGLHSTVTNVLPLKAPDGSLHWLDPASGLATDAFAPLGGTPLWRGGRVFIDGDTVTVYDGSDSSITGSWSRDDRWWLSSDHRVVTWEECEDVCTVHSFDSATGERSSSEGGHLLPGCWVAAGFLDGEDPSSVQLFLCDDPGGNASLTAGSAWRDIGTHEQAGFQAGSSTAAWHDGESTVMRFESATCDLAESTLLQRDVWVPVLGGDIHSGPSSAPVGVAGDGRVLVHLNAAGCDATAAAPGVALVDIDTGEQTTVWEGSAQLHEVRAWTSLPLAAEQVTPPEPEPPAPGPALESLVQVAPEDIGRPLLLFGDDGITRVVDGQRQQVWDQPVEEAFDDLAGGVVFQDRSVVTEHPDGRVDLERGAIWHLARGETSPQEVVPASDRPQLWAVLVTDGAESGEPLHGAPGFLWFTRADPGDPEMSVEPSATLFTKWLQSGHEREIGQAGSAMTGLDGIARLRDGRTLFSTCHIQCAIRPGLNDPDPLVMPHWLGGLDGSVDTYAFVRFWVPDLEGQPTLPTLQVWDLDDTLRHEVPLPDAIGWMTVVDLNEEGEAALVWSRDWQTGEVGGVVYVDGLDTDEPRLRAVATDQAVRFS